MSKRLKKEINLTGLKDTDSQYSQYMIGKVRKRKTPQQILGIEDKGPERIERMKMMDIVKSLYDDGESYEQE